MLLEHSVLLATSSGGQLGGGCTCDPSPPPTPAEQADDETVTVLKELLQGTLSICIRVKTVLRKDKTEKSVFSQKTKTVFVNRRISTSVFSRVFSEKRKPILI